MSCIKNTTQKTNNTLVGLMGCVFYLSSFKKLNQVIVIAYFFYDHRFFVSTFFLFISLMTKWAVAFFNCIKIKHNDFVVNLLITHCYNKLTKGLLDFGCKDLEFLDA